MFRIQIWWQTFKHTKHLKLEFTIKLVFLRLKKFEFFFFIEFIKENYEKGFLSEKEYELLMETLENNQANLSISVASQLLVFWAILIF